jgi:hypothetical protein
MKKKATRLALVGAAFVFVAAVDAQATTVPATGCSQAAVQAAINAASSGDTVLLPNSCSATWNTQVVLSSSKGITLDGNQSTITKGSIAGGFTAANALITITLGNNATTRVTNFNFEQGASSGGYFIWVSGQDNNLQFFRIDHNDFYGPTVGTHLRVNAWKGLIDHNTITWAGGGSNEVIHLEAGGASNNEPDTAEAFTHNLGGWDADVIPGQDNQIFVEDNRCVNQKTGNYSGGSCVQGYYGVRYTARFNYLEHAMFNMHGTAGRGGGRWWEIYNNSFSLRSGESANQSQYMDLNAGSGFVFGNSKSGASNGGVGEIRFCEQDSGSYPRIWQVGRGKNTKSPPQHGTDQTLTPAYSWGNSNMTEAIGNCGGSGLVEANRDVYYDSGTFNGAVGVGAGPRASRPASCTAGVGYWATDEGEWNATNGSQPDGRFYKCTASNVWTLHYTPYRYPHPGVATTGSPSSGPSAPSNLHIVP